MAGDSIGLAAAFIAGFASFVTPCVLPLIPGYLSFLTGFTPGELSARDRRWVTVLGPALLFVAGFSLVFVSMGASASLLGTYLLRYESVLTRVAGVVVFLLGLFLLGLFKLPWLYGEARFDIEKARVFGRGAAVVTGMAFAFGWTPCAGPILGAILTLAGSSGDVGRGALLLLVYSAGLAVPFVTVALLFDRLRGAIGWMTRRATIVNRMAAVLLMAVGVLIFTDRMRVLSDWLVRTFPR